MLFYTVLFVVPSLATFLYTRGQTQLSREELLNSDAAKARLRENFGPEEQAREKERKAAMNRVLFETRGSLSDRWEWANKRDEKRRREEEERQRQRQQQQS